MPTATYSILFPEMAWETEFKGWLQGAIAIISGVHYQVTFYDPRSLAQDINSELDRTPFFLERNLIVVQSVTRENMERAIELIASTGRHTDLVPESREGDAPNNGHAP